MPNLKKEGLRQEFRERLEQMEDKARDTANAAIAQRLVEFSEFGEAGVIAAYWSLPPEVDVRPAIREALADSKLVLLPRVNRDEQRLEFCPFTGDEKMLEPGPFGILEPIVPEEPVNQIDLVIVPGLAYDMHGHRLGYGAGYYDRTLKKIDAVFIGVAFDVQTIDILPTGKYDVAVDMLVTESRVIKTKQ